MAWIRETRDGLDIDVSAFMTELEAVRKKGKKRIKAVAEIKMTEPEKTETDSIILKAGNQFFKMVAVMESSSIEDLLREEYEKRFEEEKKALAIAGKEVIDEFKVYADNIFGQAQEEIRALKERLQNAAVMPDITYEHAKSGLSVTKGSSPGELWWMFRTVYAPQYMNIGHVSYQIKPAMVKRMTTPIIVLITTRRDTVLSVSTRTLNLEPFRHYHKMNAATRTRRNRRGHILPGDVGSDCWGAWKHRTTWKTADDILQIAREAINVLAAINSDSVATRNPKGMPKFDTVQVNIIKVKEKVEENLNKAQDRAGLGGVAANRGGWTFDPSVIA